MDSHKTIPDYVRLRYDKKLSSKGNLVFKIISNYRISNGNELGKVCYYPKRKSYVFMPYSNTNYDWEDLVEIAKVIRGLKRN